MIGALAHYISLLAIEKESVNRRVFKNQPRVRLTLRALSITTVLAAILLLSEAVSRLHGGHSHRHYYHPRKAALKLPLLILCHCLTGC